MRLMDCGLIKVSNGRVNDLIFHMMSFLTCSRERCQGLGSLTLADHIDAKIIFHVPKGLTNGSFMDLSILATFGGCEYPPAVPDHPSTFPRTSCTKTLGASCSPHPSCGPSGIICFDLQRLTY